MKKVILIVISAILLVSCGTPAAQTGAPQTSDPQTDAHMGAGRETVTAVEPASDVPQTDVPQTDPPQTDSPDPPDTAAPQYPAGEYLPEVFMYHLILDEPYSVYENLFVRPAELRAHIGVLNSLGYDYAFAEDYGVKERPTAILTFDDGYEDNYTEMFPILKESGAKATVFLVKSLVGTAGYLTEEQIREMSASGLVSFQTHTVSHLELAAMSAERIAGEMAESIEYIEALTGKEVRALAYPAGRYSDTAVAEVAKFVDFAYTTEVPGSVSAENLLLIPRWRVPRGYSGESFRALLGK